MELEPGYRFMPSDEDLIYYLNKKVNGGKITCQALGECDMYGNKQPWEIWNDHGGLKVKSGEDVYLFTKLKKVSANGKRINRRVGSGTWSGANSGEVVEGVAEKRHFRYESNGGRDHGAWIMHEYRLLHHHHHHPGDDDHEYVLCRLRRKTSTDQDYCRSERKRPRKLRNQNINIQEYPRSSTISEEVHDHHHQETNINMNPIQKLDDDTDQRLMVDYYLNLQEHEKWSLMSSSSRRSSSGGAAAHDQHLMEINPEDFQAHHHIDHHHQDQLEGDQQHNIIHEDNNYNVVDGISFKYITDDDQIGFDDLCDWGVVFAADHDDDGDELMEISQEEFHIHEKPSSSTTTFQNELEGGGEEEEKDGKRINMAVEDDEDEAFDKFAEKLEDMLGLEINGHDGPAEEFQADNQVEGDGQQHMINLTTGDHHGEQLLQVEDNNYNVVHGISFAQELQNIPLYFAPLPPEEEDDQIEEMLFDFFNF